MTTTQLQVNILLKKEGPFWVAQCLQYDVAGQGKTIQDAVYQAERCLVGHMALCIRDDKELALPAAPQEYWRMWEKAEPLRERQADPFRADMAPPVSVKPELRVQ